MRQLQTRAAAYRGGEQVQTAWRPMVPVTQLFNRDADRDRQQSFCLLDAAQKRRGTERSPCRRLKIGGLPFRLGWLAVWRKVQLHPRDAPAVRPRSSLLYPSPAQPLFCRQYGRLETVYLVPALAAGSQCLRRRRRGEPLPSYASMTSTTDICCPRPTRSTRLSRARRPRRPI